MVKTPQLSPPIIETARNRSHELNCCQICGRELYSGYLCPVCRGIAGKPELHEAFLIPTQKKTDELLDGF